MIRFISASSLVAHHPGLAYLAVKARSYAAAIGPDHTTGENVAVERRVLLSREFFKVTTLRPHPLPLHGGAVTAAETNATAPVGWSYVEV